jgi:membrane-associated phospholipid phosphatase
MTGIALIFLIGFLIGLRLAKMTAPPLQFVPLVLLVLALVGGAAFYRWRGLEKPVNLIMMALWGVVFSNLHVMPMFIAARQKVEFCDPLFARLDASLGMEVPDVIRVVSQYPWLRSVLRISYDTLIFMVMLAVMVPPMCGKMQAAKQYAIAGLLAAMICIPIFAVLQAVGPWVHYGYVPDIDQENYMRTFSALKTQDWYVFDISYRDGLICFPSFHTILAILAGIALWSIPYLRWPAAVMATLIVISTVTTGTHYVIDVVAGIGVAAVAFAGARGYTLLESKLAPQPDVKATVNS